MPSPIPRRSPLGEIQSAESPPPDGQLVERPFLTHLNLRLHPDDAEALAAVHQVIGVQLPLTPNTITAGGDVTAIWLGPDEWLLLAEHHQSDALVADLQDALASHFASVVDISAGQTVIRLRGPSTLDVLARGCALDLHPTVFPPGACAQTLLARAQALLVAVDDTPTFDIVVRRSFAPYVAAWLEDSGRQFGLHFPTSDTA
ncbi:MAG: sarcosine oxidase subunit gamma [Chloroflexota bacterium]|nr:sarcosine oxidase subunit gamma [Chloroflexota bacterium]MDE2919642.1 sarcosine oxidase subunit gamma [Chloroflexota bacterium]